LVTTARAYRSPLALFRATCLAVFIALLTAYVSEAASPIRQLTSTTAQNFRPALSPDGNRIAFQSDRDGRSHIYVMDSDGGNVMQITRGDSDDRHPSWSPDGRSLAIDSGSDLHREIWTVDVSSKRRTQITRLGAIASFPSWSPNGKRITFYVYESAAMVTDLWLTTPDGSSPTRLTRQLASVANNQCTSACHAASWSPDSSRIALSDGDLSRVIIISALGGLPTPISPSGEHSHFPIFLPDGRIVYVTEHVSIDQSWTDIWAIDPDRSSMRAEIATQVQLQGPFEFSADAGRLLFASPRSGNFEIYSVTLDEAGKAALAIRPQRISPAMPATAGRDAGFGLPATAEPYLLGFGLLALLAAGVEGAMRARRRSRTDPRP
jgi:Tol biopolymer transport system component